LLKSEWAKARAGPASTGLEDIRATLSVLEKDATGLDNEERRFAEEYKASASPLLGTKEAAMDLDNKLIASWSFERAIAPSMPGALVYVPTQV
jgi:hypothetical protein